MVLLHMTPPIESQNRAVTLTEGSSADSTEVRQKQLGRHSALCAFISVYSLMHTMLNQQKTRVTG